MQKVTILCVGKLKEKFYIDAAAEYVKRLSRFCKLELVELPEERLPEAPSPAASESAQVVIMNDNIAAVPRAIAIARRTKRVMLQAVIAGLVLATIGMIAAAFNLIPVVVGAFLQEAIDVVSILWALTALIDRD